MSPSEVSHLRSDGITCFPRATGFHCRDMRCPDRSTTCPKMASTPGTYRCCKCGSTDPARPRNVSCDPYGDGLCTDKSHDAPHQSDVEAALDELARCAEGDDEFAAIATVRQRISTLTAKCERAMAALRLARGVVKQSLDDVGGCDHSVGLCMCGEREVLREIDATLGGDTDA